MQTHVLKDGTESFNVSVHQTAIMHSPAVLFAVGAGGQPERYTTLLQKLVESGCTVIAPHFERLASPFPSESDLTLRARRLSLALNSFLPPGQAAVGVGHSIGAATLVALVGGQMWLGPAQRVNIANDSRLARLVVLAPPTGFFQAPGALNEVRVPILAWVGSVDEITPPLQIEFLADALRDWQTVDVRITDGAGHFSFMDIIPPHVTEPLPNKRAFLRDYATEICRFVLG